jgi:hypothetical protein
MKKPLIILAAVVLFMFTGFYFTFLSPSAVMKHNTEKMLQQFAEAVDSQDRTKVAAVLNDIFTDDAKIHLDVAFSAISASNLRPMAQDFDKPAFLTFIDNVLFTVHDYHYRPKLENFSLPQKDKAALQFTSGQWADGPSFFSGVTLEVHFSGDAQCSGEAVFDGNRQPKLQSATCNVLLRSMAKADSSADMVKKAQEIHDKAIAP